MHQQPPSGIDDQHVHRPVAQVARPHLGPADHPHRAAVRIELLDRLAPDQPDSTDDTRIRPVFPLARWNPAQPTTSSASVRG
ncbi:MAG: hypothetical protein E6J41_06115 [Chloroflexi bacterium]|nr:MAG: hypothetical protein E6J41_06115 [Chloroflexota bacterium]